MLEHNNETVRKKDAVWMSYYSGMLAMVSFIAIVFTFIPSRDDELETHD